ncbi:MAG: hypothetical protein U0236_03700 [Nitrospira sp.]
MPLEGWYIPANGVESDKLAIFNHALPMCRAGFQGHFGEPWSNYDAVEIDFVIQMKHLTDAGYNVLAYDVRNNGRSGASNGGVSDIGRIEWRDCVGVKKYVDGHSRLSKMKVGLYSQCMGGNSQYEASKSGKPQAVGKKLLVTPGAPVFGIEVAEMTVLVKEL